MVPLLQRYSKQSLYKSPVSNFAALQDCLTQFPALLSYHPPASRNRETKPLMLLVRLMTSSILLVRARAVLTHLCLSCLCCTPFIPRYRASPLHHHQHQQTHKPTCWIFIFIIFLYAQSPRLFPLPSQTSIVIKVPLQAGRRILYVLYMDRHLPHLEASLLALQTLWIT